MKRRLLQILAAILLTLLAPGALAQAVAYDNIDQATVRVLGMGNIELEAIEDEGQTYQLAVPIAGHGSGVLLSKDGLILTAAHVIDDTRALAVLVPGHLGPLPAVAVYTDTTRDFALLRVKGDFEHVAELADPKASLAIRQNVFAIGYPLDATRMDPQSTPGIVSGVLPTGELQLGMSVNPGNSGGPVVDSDGKVRAIVVARSRLDEGAIGLAYAVPLKTFAETVTKYLTKPADATQLAYLEADTSRRLADLTSLMSLYGLEVMKTSLSKSEMEVDPRIKGALDEASQGAHASTDGRLLSAVFYWNQSLVMRRRGDTNWPTAQAKAVGLVREAAKAEPALQTKSPFVKLLLGLPPTAPGPASGTGDPANPWGTTYGSSVQPPTSAPATDKPKQPEGKPLKLNLKVLLGIEIVPTLYNIDLHFDARLSAGVNHREHHGRTVLAYGARVGFQTAGTWSVIFGGELQQASGSFTCDYCYEPTTSQSGGIDIDWSTTQLGPYAGLTFKGLYLGGKVLWFLPGSNGDEPFHVDGAALGVEGGYLYSYKRLRAGALLGAYWGSGEVSEYENYEFGYYDTVETSVRAVQLSAMAQLAF
ncbi:MAG: trypsin-like peptidase domain-containing protein [Polyangiaceae bacterium]|nr:trypsin-like peptidase domain-containing protein [Polyangiaceae bacterium]MCB9609993.1 trypsin-like peptidase domain-containing protein [Polyangiaceae bacterium]